MIEIGQLVDGKYRILRQIGKGGMSVVYLALNEKANKTWAIKEVRKDGVQDFNVVKQGLVAEIDMLKKLNHPNLPSIIDVIDGDGSFLIVMDYIEGVPLDKRVKEQGAQDQDDVIEWAIQLCDVLGYLHGRKPPIIYRDMKPANVMLKPEGQVTLIDFGTAREFKESSVEDTVVLGTRGYAAPEQYGGHGQTDARTDIYCLGATMYHLITGHNPSAYPYEMYPIRKWNSLLSSGLEKIILKCTQKNPEERYQSCAELMYALEHYKDEDIEARKSRRKKLKAFTASVIACLAMVIFAGIFKGLETVKTADSYDIYLNNAVSTQDISESFAYFRKAQILDPQKADVYEEALKYVKNDGVLEYNEISELERLTNNTNYLDKFKNNNQEKYSRFCYDLAETYYFYSADKQAGKQKSIGWFGKACDLKQYLGDVEKRAEIMKSIAEITYKNRWGKQDENGDKNPETTYTSGWEKYHAIIFDVDIAKVENVSNAISVYNSFAFFVIENASGFFPELQSDKLIADMNNLMSKTENLRSYSSYDAKSNESRIDELKKNIEKAIYEINRAKDQKGDYASNLNEKEAE